MPTAEQKLFFEKQGYFVENLLTINIVAYYSNLFDSFLDNSMSASCYRSDLYGDMAKDEKITQIMVPSKLVREQSVGHTREIAVKTKR